MKQFINDIQNAIQTLKKGGIILYPTDTIWGIGCDANNVKGIMKIAAIKERSVAKKMIILIPDYHHLEKYVVKLPPKVKDLMGSFKKPTTVIFPKGRNLPSILLGDDKSLAVRIPNDPFCSQLLKNFGKPIISTSANRSREDSPANFKAISEIIKSSVDYVVKYNQNSKFRFRPSSIIKIHENDKIEFIRK